MNYWHGLRVRGCCCTRSSSAAENPVHDEIKVLVKGPLVALSRASHDFRECPDPVLFGYPTSSLDMMTMDDMHPFVAEWFERAVAAGMGRCFVCNQRWI